jgi:hypothetical protein
MLLTKESDIYTKFLKKEWKGFIARIESSVDCGVPDVYMGWAPARTVVFLELKLAHKSGKDTVKVAIRSSQKIWHSKAPFYRFILLGLPDGELLLLDHKIIPLFDKPVPTELIKNNEYNLSFNKNIIIYLKDLIFKI